MRHNMIVTSVTGHICELDFGASHRKWQTCDPVELFDAPVNKSVTNDKKQICKTLEREARKCNKLILWLDCDREGENIAYEVIDVCRKANPRLNIKRARFSSLVPREIWNAINNLIEPNKNESDAVDARQEIDLRIGAAFTRFQTMRVQNKTIIDTVVSYGPCQFPTLGFVVDAWRRRQNFQPETFWSIKVEITTNGDGNGDGDGHNNITSKQLQIKKKGNPNDYIQQTEHAIFNWKRGKLFDRRATLILYELCVSTPLAVVERVDKREKLKYRPYPLETVELQKRASRWLRLTSQRTMHIAETLYQRGFLSYPRTETNKFPNGLDLRRLIGHHINANGWGQYAQRLLNDNKFRTPTRGKKDDKAHPPIHPTKFDQNAYNGFSTEEKKVYEFVVRHFLACCSEHAKGFESKVTINIAGEEFTTTGLIILERNYLDIYRYERWNGKIIPEFLENQSFIPDSIEMTSGNTTAPELLSEEQLIALMDKHGIGTDATMAQHIETIQQRQYAIKRERKFHPEKLGIALCNAYDRMDKTLSKPYLRANMESRMQMIAEGRLDKQQFLQSCLSEMKRIFQDVQRNAVTLDQAVSEFFNAVNNSISEEIQRGLSRCQCGSRMSLKGQGRVDGGNGRRGRGRGRGRGRRGRGRGRGRGNSFAGNGGYRTRFLHCSSCANAAEYNPNQVSDLKMPRGTLSAKDFNCPICNYQVLNVKNEETGKEHTVCPYCFNNPPNDQVAADNSLAPGNFRCFMCKNSNCLLSGGGGGNGGGGSIVKDCNLCHRSKGGQMVLKWIAKCSKFAVGCNKWRDGCKNTIWIPFCKQETKVSQQRCNRCGANKIDFVFDSSLPQSLGVPPNHTGCCTPNCDDMIDLVLEYERQSKFGGSGNNNSNNNNSNNNNSNNNNYNRNNDRGSLGSRFRNNSRNIGSARLRQTHINAHPSNGQGYLVNNDGSRVNSANNYSTSNNHWGNNDNNSNNNNSGSDNAFSFMMNNSGKGRGRGRGRGRGKSKRGRKKKSRGRGRGRGKRGGRKY